MTGTVVLSDRQAFREEIAERWRAQRGETVVAFAQASQLFDELRARPPRIALVDLEHGHDDPLAIIRDLRARWPQVMVAGVGLARGWRAPPPATGDGVPVRTIWRRLTPRQREVLTHVGEGEANLTIAARLGISERAVKAHVSALLSAFLVENRTQLAVSSWALRQPG